MVKDLGGDLHPFSPEKLLISIYQSLAHRKTAVEDATAVCRTVIDQVRRQSQEAVVERDTLVSVAATTLDRFDTLAGTHYGAYHPRKT